MPRSDQRVTWLDVDTAESTELAGVSPVGALGDRMGITIVEASPERVTGTMPVEGNTQPYGLLHGGASAVLAESLGSTGAALHGSTVDRPFTVGVDLNATHHKAVRSGTVTGVATAVHRGRTMATYEIVITDEAGDRVCTARLTCLLRGA
jgi:1,4-dihydroxy-2-naphthoyl-CoA hydrolase